MLKNSLNFKLFEFNLRLNFSKEGRKYFCNSSEGSLQKKVCNSGAVGLITKVFNIPYVNLTIQGFRATRPGNFRPGEKSNFEPGPDLKNRAFTESLTFPTTVWAGNFVTDRLFYIILEF